MDDDVGKSPQKKKHCGRQEATGGRQGGPQQAGSTLFIGGIPQHWRNDDLSYYFSRFGSVSSAVVVLHREGENVGQSRGFGFVTFVQQADASSAIAQQHARPIEGRAVTVKAAEERRGGGAFPRGSVGASHSGSPGVQLPPRSTQVCIYVHIHIHAYTHT